MKRLNDRHRDEMHRSVRLRHERREHWKREGERSITENLALIGALGWLIVVPALCGVLLGRWIDGLFDTGILWTAALIVAGLVIGFYMAWKRMERE